MAMGTRKQREALGHPLNQKVNELLETECFDELIENRCAKLGTMETMNVSTASPLLQPDRRQIRIVRHDLVRCVEDRPIGQRGRTRCRPVRGGGNVLLIVGRLPAGKS